jgi:hypothetical protein
VLFAQGANLSRANLANARLTAADLSGTILTAANLSGAQLDAARLSTTNLAGARLNKASLNDTLFEAADVSEADLSHAIVDFTKFLDIDLSRAKGLECLNHTGPSIIGIETLFLSQGNIPDKFLRSAGVPEEVIDIARSLRSGLPIQFCSCFISYSHEDKAFADLLYDRLQARGIRCWLDEHQLLPGDDLHEGIDRGIRLWDKVLLCASKASLTSWWVDSEINRAFQKEAQIMKERGVKVLALIPLNLDGYLFSADYQGGKKTEITSRVAANFVGWEKDHALFDWELEKVIRALRTGEGGREKPPSPRL